MHLLSIKPVDLFQALADPTRIRVIRLLIQTKEESCLCELSESLAVPDYSLSRHLKVLRQVGLLTAVKEGRWVYHRIAEGPEYLNELVAVVRLLPDQDKAFASDLIRFKKSASFRTEGRCRGDKELPAKRVATR